MSRTRRRERSRLRDRRLPDSADEQRHVEKRREELAQLKVAAPGIDWQLAIDQPTGTRLVVQSRVSNRKQRNHLDHDRAELLRLAHSRGHRVAARRFQQVAPGWSEKHLAQLQKIAVRCRKTGRSLFVSSPDRLARGRKQISLAPTPKQWAIVARILTGIAVVIEYLPSESRGAQTKRGQAAKKSLATPPPRTRGPYRKPARDQLLNKVWRMAAKGQSLTRVAARVGKSKSTVHRWVVAARNENGTIANS
jgi:hypothetical protein